MNVTYLEKQEFKSKLLKKDLETISEKRKELESKRVNLYEITKGTDKIFKILKDYE